MSLTKVSYSMIQGAFANVLDYGADPTGVSDSTAAINSAIASGSSVYFPVGTYLTTGNHTITNQTITGAGKATTIIKRSSGSNDVFRLVGNGTIQDLTIDGNSTWGNGIFISTTTYGQLVPSLVNNVEVKNVGTTATPVTITGITNAAQCQITAANHGFSVGDYVDIRTVTGLVSTNNPTKSVVSGLWQVKTASTNTFTIDLDTTDWTAYVSGGQVLRTSFGICVETIAGGGTGFVKTINNVELRNNDNHIFIWDCWFSAFNNIYMIGSNTRAAIYIHYSDSVRFNNVYMEGAIETFYYSVRDLTFNDLSINIQPSNTFTGPLIRSIGMNYAEGLAGGEVAGLTLNNVTIYRYKDFGTVPVFQINPYQASFNHIHILDNHSPATCYVFGLYGIQDWSLRDLTIEFTYAWDLFDPVWNLGNAITAENLRYTQGYKGTATWSNYYPGAGDLQVHIAVKGSNFNHATVASARGYWFENVKGNIDLTNANAGGSFIFGNHGTVTDPNGAVNLRVDENVNLYVHTPYTYADNAAALAGGLVAGQVYKTSTGVLMVVY